MSHLDFFDKNGDPVDSESVVISFQWAASCRHCPLAIRANWHARALPIVIIVRHRYTIVTNRGRGFAVKRQHNNR
ncbi:hypothetical protein [Nitrosomonas sp. ANs5]|uniref:hypothetical protein n=1 Tax=Nitrosomonas sp. ANs5 TaxID=3423941 RepID=UPI003D352A3C